MQLRDLQQQYLALRPELDEALMRVASSGNYILGAEVNALEEELAAFVGVKHCISCANGTDALRLALMALGVGAGDAVFVPDFTFFASAEAVAMVGATPVFVDVEADTFNISVASLAAAIARTRAEGTLRPRAVVAVDLFGLPANYPALMPLCQAEGLLLIEDGAQGFGGSIGGRKACSFGHISTTSFFPAKPLGCYGDGGALFTDSDTYAALLRSLRVHGRGQDKYDNVRLGLNSRLDAMQAAVLRVKLRHFEGELATVRRLADFYSHRLQGLVDLPAMPQYTSAADPTSATATLSAWAQYTLRTPRRDTLQTALASQGIASAIYYPRPLSRQTAFAPLGQDAAPVADALCRTVLSIPLHPYLSDAEAAQVADAVEQAITKN